MDTNTQGIYRLAILRAIAKTVKALNARDLMRVLAYARGLSRS